MTRNLQRAPFALVIARAQLTHFGHGSLFSKGLEVGERLIVVLGSAFKARDIRNPFTWEERKQMILLSLPEGDRDRVLFVPVRDYADNDRWSADVKKKVGLLVGRNQEVRLVGHMKEDTTYLDDFPGWTTERVGRSIDINSSSLRKMYFATGLEVALLQMQNYVHHDVVEYLRSFACLDAYQALREEWAATERYQQKYPLGRTYLTADAVLQFGDSVVLIERGGEHGTGLLAFPGGFLNPGEQFYPGAVREAREETSYNPMAQTLKNALVDSEVFDHPGRSIRGRLVTRAFHFRFGDPSVTPEKLPEFKARDDARRVVVVKIADLAKLENRFFEDHILIADRFFNIFAEDTAAV